MKLPNGYGSVYKLSGKRRNPWCARLTVGWTFDQVKGKSYPVYKFLGYYPKRQDALNALADYHRDPWDLDRESVTFAEIFDLWSSERFPEGSCGGYGSAYKICEPLHRMKVRDIKLHHLQECLDQSGKNTPMLKTTKILLGLMWDYCVKHEILPPDKRTMIRYLDVSKAGNPNKITRTVFTKEEVYHLWDLQEDERIQIFLFLIYTGLRVSELYNLKMEDLHLQERFFSMNKSKTEAGVRDVPICEKIVPIIQHWLEKGTVFLFTNRQGNQLKDRTFRNIIWEPVIDQLNMNHLPHDTRHTTVSLLTKAGVDDRIIKQIIGHKGTGVTQQVYTHIDLQTKLEAINRI